MLFSLLQRYSLKVTFALALLLGLQVPHFLSLYETRLDAHYQESSSQLEQYQKLADLMFAGDLDALIEEHRNSKIALFRAETKILEKLILRARFLQDQKSSLQGGLIKRYSFLASQLNQPLFIETQKNYQANVVLNKEAIIVGLIIATLTTLLLELILLLSPLLLIKCKQLGLQKSIN